MTLAFLHFNFACFFIFREVEWRILETLICNWMPCVPHWYYYCIQFNVGEQSISIVFHSFLSLFPPQLPFMHTVDTQDIDQFRRFSASNTCMCWNVIEQKPRMKYTDAKPFENESSQKEKNFGKFSGTDSRSIRVQAQKYECKKKLNSDDNGGGE